MPRRPTTRLRLTPLEDRLTPAGGLDPTFGTGGVVTITPGNSGARPSVVAQSDGHLLVVTGNGPHGTQVTRYNADGSLDTGFGTAGTVGDLVPGSRAIVNDVAVGPDGKLTLSGVSSPSLNQSATAVVLLNADGTPDAGFGTNGVANYDAALWRGDAPGFPRQIPLASHDLTVLPDGSIVVAAADGGAAAVLVRLTAAGVVDTAYGVGGPFYRATPTVEFNTVTDLAAAPDGGVFLLESRRTLDNHGLATDAPVLFKLTPAGRLDASFDGDGVVPVSVGRWGGGLALAVQPDGKVLVAVSHSNDGVVGLAPGTVEVLRLDADGSPDAAFGGGRVVALADGGHAGTGSLALLPDGRVVVASGRYLAQDAGVAVLNPDGSPSHYFAGGGSVGGLNYGVTALTATPVAGLAISGGRIAVLSDVYIDFDLVPIGLAVLTEGPTALPLPPRPPAVEFPPLPVVQPPEPPTGGGPIVTIIGPPLFADPSATPAVNVVAPPPQPKASDVVAYRYHTPGDINDDGVADKVVTDGATVSVVSGKDGSVLLKPFAPFEASYTDTLNAVFVDANGDGLSELVVSPGQGGGPVVAVYNADGTERGRFWGIDDTNFRGGVNLVTGDVNGDGRFDLVATAGQGGGPRVAVFDGKTLGANAKRFVADFFAFEATQTGGATASVVNGLSDHGPGLEDATLIFGAGAGGGPRVRGVSGSALLGSGGVKSLDDLPAAARRFDRFVADPALRNGVRLGFMKPGPFGQEGVTADPGTGMPEVVFNFGVVE